MTEKLKQFSDRWDALKANPGVISVSEQLPVASLAKLSLFKDFDGDTLEKLSPDIAIVKWKDGATIFSEGSYTDTAYYIITGNVKLLSSAIPESNENILSLAGISKMTLRAGDIFGEIGSVSGWPQTFTAVTTSPVTLLHLRAPALRHMRKKNKPLHSLLEKEYRQKGLTATLKSVPIFKNIPELSLLKFADRFEILSYEPNEVVFYENDLAESIYVVRAGFIKISQRAGDTEIILNYLSRGSIIGEIEFFNTEQAAYHFTASSVEYLDLIRIPFEVMRKLMSYDFKLPIALRELAKETAHNIKIHSTDLKHSALMQASMDTGAIEGTSILVIDLDRCTRCDDCVRGCADTHGGIPRFVREGNRFENHLVTRACYQCRDPLCLIGCPTGAIHRRGIGEVVQISDDLCIGCKVCANNCPYDAIVMHDTGERWGNDTLPQNLRGKDRLLASKCDLCDGLNHGPACVESCPIGCAVRVGSIEELS